MIVDFPKKLYNITMPIKDINLSEKIIDRLLPLKKTENKVVLPASLEKAEATVNKAVELANITEGVASRELSSGASPANQSRVINNQQPHFLEVEKILEDGLAEVYQNLPPASQQVFKIKGEQTVAQIANLLNTAKLSLAQFSKQVFNLIIGWLKVIPGVNKYFLEQEAKIKADKILSLRK